MSPEGFQFDLTSPAYIWVHFDGLGLAKFALAPDQAQDGSDAHGRSAELIFAPACWLHPIAELRIHLRPQIEFGFPRIDELELVRVFVFDAKPDGARGRIVNADLYYSFGTDRKSSFEASLKLQLREASAADHMICHRCKYQKQVINGNAVAYLREHPDSAERQYTDRSEQQEPLGDDKSHREHRNDTMFGRDGKLRSETRRTLFQAPQSNVSSGLRFIIGMTFKKPLFLAVLLIVAAASGQAIAQSDAPNPIESVYLARDNGDGKPGEEVTYFGPDDIPIYCVVKLSEPQIATFKMLLFAVDVAGVKPETRVVTSDYTTKKGEDTVYFSGRPRGKWTAGIYRFEILVDGKKATELRFEIRSLSRKGAPSNGRTARSGRN